MGRVTARLRPDRIGIGPRQDDRLQRRTATDLQALFKIKDRDAAILGRRVLIGFAATYTGDKIECIDRIGNGGTGRDRRQRQRQQETADTHYINHSLLPRQLVSQSRH